ncbi:unnamed protein product [Dibothriocephalus latus]|uniref:Uncharacterized protein n=1 Tax=Dibothriocephalus latus TaxID=60516 RepID=A0A3P7M619_DIBLA|nr:unnamed protein product [Dibothriocephalus latus]
MAISGQSYQSQVWVTPDSNPGHLVIECNTLPLKHGLVALSVVIRNMMEVLLHRAIWLENTRNFAELCFGSFMGRPMSSSTCADLMSTAAASSTATQNGVFGASAANSVQHPHHNQHAMPSSADLKAKKARHR